ncbi:MAG: hypothetical protein QF673_03865 [Candidatus Hydrothermarchaeota archaeon]|jgi:hypothetical protein|nr:hypothetical protein [Candidatus Hydrothermarchaeota archaeon]
MCRNYNDSKCIANNDKKCLLGKDGAEAKQGDCELHGDYNVWKLKDEVVVSNTGREPEGGKVLGYRINFLTADEQAYKKSKRLKVPVDYDLD